MPKHPDFGTQTVKNSTKTGLQIAGPKLMRSAVTLTKRYEKCNRNIKNIEYACVK